MVINGHIIPKCDSGTDPKCYSCFTKQSFSLFDENALLSII